MVEEPGRLLGGPRRLRRDVAIDIGLDFALREGSHAPGTEVFGNQPVPAGAGRRGFPNTRRRSADGAQAPESEAEVMRRGTAVHAIFRSMCDRVHIMRSIARRQREQ